MYKTLDNNKILWYLIIYLKLIFLIFVVKSNGDFCCEYDFGPAANQLVSFKQNTSGPVGVLTTLSGAPVGYKEATSTLNAPLMYNSFFMDTITRLSRERIPERMVHARGAGAFGEFILTNDMSHFCKAKVFNGVGKRTPVAVRFSHGTTNAGGDDTRRDSRGFAVKFYTEEGNFDMVGLNMPVFLIRDPMLFATCVRSQKRNPVTNILDQNMLWDFYTLNHQSVHASFFILGDFGIPYTYRHMPGFSVHTYEVVNQAGDYSFVRFHFMPNAGIKSMHSKEGKKLAGEDPEYHTRDLYGAIDRGDYPSWNVSLQILSLENVKSAKFDVFDITKALPVDEYPLTPLGVLVLNRNSQNYFAEIEQLAFCPANLVPGILGSPDKIFEARLLAYRDAQYHRLETNFMDIPVNRPLHKSHSYIRDGPAAGSDNGVDGPNYFPNSFNGASPRVYAMNPPLMTFHQTNANNYEQASRHYNSMPEDERVRLVENIVDYLKPAHFSMWNKTVTLYSFVSSDLAKRIAEALNSC